MIFFPKGRWIRYSQSKLANVVFTACLHDKLKNTGIKALVAHPGVAATDLQINTMKDGGMSSFLSRFLIKGAQSQEDGALGILKAMLDPDAKSGTFYGPGSGQFAFKGNVINFPLTEYETNQAAKAMLWEKSCQAIGEDFVL